MHKANITRIDLNLLLVFDAVARNRSVTAAAGQLSLSQPAVSHALNRLRVLVGDPLFVRSRAGLVATPRAAAMIHPVGRLIDAAHGVLAHREFDPVTTTQTYRVAASDYSMLTVVPKLVELLRSRAPGSNLEVHNVSERTLSCLETGEIDIAFWGDTVPTSPFLGRTLFRETFIGLICANHPLAKKARRRKIAITDYLAFPHMRVSFGSPRPSPVDVALAERGLQRKVAVVTPNFASNVASLPGSDLILSIPRRLVSEADTRRIVTFALPLVVPAYAYSVIWHKRTEADRSLQWLREGIADMFEPNQKG